MIGQTVAQYQIDSRLGSGGMGVVYRALDTKLQRQVALKFLPPNLSQDEEAKQRFMQEARAASALDHANICTVHDIAETDDGQLYIVMAFYDGETLKYRLRNGPLPEQEALSIARQIALGLARAHEAGIVHRDVKPANIMVTERGDVKILDFGVAKLESSSDLTRAGSTVGTAAYMSPEQARGERVGPAADLWSLGVVLYEMLSGKRPFDAEYDQALAYAILNEDPAPIAGVTADTSAIVRRLLAKMPGDRFESSGRAAEALGASGVRPVVHADSISVSAQPASAAGVTDSTAAASDVRTNSTGGTRMMGAFAAIAVVSLALLYAAMMAFGLPDWVFSFGVVLMIAGFPILWYADRIEARRRAMDSGERRALSGLAAWLTVERARWGGVLAMAGLGLVAAGWMGMRALGIGPAGTLVTRGVLSEEDKVLVAEFDDQTAAGGLGRTISEALRIDLAQSSVVTLLDPSEVRRVLEFMQRDPSTTRLDVETAREVARRSGAKAVVAGDIASLGSSYVLSLKLLDAVTGQELVPLRETADNDADIVRAVDRLSKALRERIGESLKTIRGTENLEDVSTASLEALRQYTMGVDAFEAGDYDRTVTALSAAIRADSNFAMAYRKLSVTYRNMQSRPDEMVRLAKKAWDLRDRLPKIERYYAQAWFHNVVERDPEAVLATYETMLKEFPENGTALNNAAVSAFDLGDLEKGLRFARAAIRTGEPVSVYYDNYVFALASLGRIDEVKDAIDSLAIVLPGHPNIAWWRGTLLGLETGDYAAAIDTLRGLRARTQDASYRSFIDQATASMSLYQGRLAQARRDLAARSALDMSPEESATSLLMDSFGQAMATGDVSGLSGQLDDIEATWPMESMEPLGRPYSFTAYLRALAGDVSEARRLLDAQTTTWPESWLRRDATRHAAMAVIASREGRDLDAVAELRRARTVASGDTRRAFLLDLARALVAVDSLDAAADLLNLELGRPGITDFQVDLGTLPQTWRTLGDVSESLGRNDEALEAYRQFVTMWANADPELQPQVADVQARIDRLLALQAREGNRP